MMTEKDDRSNGHIDPFNPMQKLLTMWIVTMIFQALGYDIKTALSVCYRPVTSCFENKDTDQDIILKLGNRPTAGEIEAALVQHHALSPELCVSIIKRYADRCSNYYSRGQEPILTPISLAIGWSISQRNVLVPEALHPYTYYNPRPYVSLEASHMHRILDEQYIKLPGVPNRTRLCSACMMKCVSHDNIPVIRALLEIEPRLAGMFIEQGVTARRPDTIAMISEEYPQALLF